MIMPKSKPKLLLPFNDWPESDKELWHAAMRDDDPFADAAGARLAKSSLHVYWKAWRRFLGFLTITEPAALEIAPPKRLTAERVRRYAEHLQQTNTPRSVAIQIEMLYGVARAMMPDLDLQWLRVMRARLRSAAPRGGAAKPVITSVQLLELGLQLMDESNLSASAHCTMADAVHYRDGLMIALLAYVPLRVSNFVGIEIDGDLVKEHDKWFIVIQPEENKTRTHLEFQIPDDLENQFSTYINYVRPYLLRRPECKALWVSSKGGALSASAFSPIMAKYTNNRLGIRITPHDARDAAATTWAIAAPDRVGVARDLLAHSDIRTTTKYYNRAKGIEASRAHAVVLAGMRKEVRTKTKPRS
jgi:integrase/recombinase XerD